MFINIHVSAAAAVRCCFLDKNEVALNNFSFIAIL